MFFSNRKSWINELLRLWSGRTRTIQSQSRRSARPRVELLEDRLAPAVYTVTTVASYNAAGSLQAEIAAAVTANDPAAVIVFSGVANNSTITLSAATINASIAYGPAAYYINGTTGANITIEGGTAPGLIINGANAVRLFAVAPANSLTLDDITLENGTATGGAGGTGDSGGGGAGGFGGAVYVAENATLTIQSSLLSGNTAVGGAGGTGTGVYGGGGGGGGLDANGGTGAAGANSAGGVGGGPNGAPSNATNPGTIGGYGGGGGGGAATSTGWGGTGGGFGGGAGGESNAAGNSWPNYSGGGFGGGGAGNASATGTLLTGGYGGGTGGQNGANSGGGGGAGMGGAIFSNGTVTITNSTLFNNSAIGGTAGTGGQNGSGLGGAIFERDGTVTLLGDTITGSTAAQGGTGVFLMDNTAAAPGVSTAAAAVINNTIIGSNGAAPSVTDFAAANAGGGTSLVTSGVGDLIRLQSGFNGTIVSAASPNLAAALASNGGPTQTLTELGGSPAIGAGSGAAITLGAAITTTNATSITVSSGTSFLAPEIIQIGTEAMLVTAVSGTTLTVVRGYNNTTAATHANAANVLFTLDQRGYALPIAATTPDIGAYQSTGTTPSVPTITNINPSTGPLAGGTSIAITGTNLANATAVTFGTAGPGTIVSDTGTVLTVTDPAGAAGIVATTVTTVTWDTSASSNFTYSNVTYTYGDNLAAGVLSITQLVPAANDNLTFSLSGGNYIITDTGALTFAAPTGSGAASISGGTTSTITIPAAAVTSISFILGTGTNTFTFLGTNGAAAAPITVNDGTTAGDQVVISAPVLDSGAVALTGNTISESGTGTLNAGAAAVTLSATTSVTQASATGLITAGALSITAGAIGAPAQSLVLNVTTLTSNSAATNGQQWFKDTGTVLIPSAGAMNSGTGGIWFTGGTFKDGAVNALTVNNPLFVDTPGIFDLNGFNQTVSALNDTGTVTDSGAAATLTVTGTGAFSGAITGANTSLTVNGAAATMTLSGANTYGGATAIQAGTLKLGANNTLPTTSALTFGAAATAGTLDLAGFNQTVAGLSVAGGATAANQIVGNSSTTTNSTLTVAAGASTFAGIIKNVIGAGTKTVGLTVSGGSLTLTGADTYTGATAVSAGTLLVNSPGTIAASTGVAVSGTGVLGGSGAVPAITATGGSVNPGSAIGTPGILTAGTTNLSAGGNLTLDIAGLATPGTTYSELNLGANNLILGGTSSLTLNLASLAAAGTATQTIVMTTGTITGTFASTNVINGAGFAAYVSAYGASSITITIYVPTATSIVVSSGSPQTTTVNTAFSPLVATVDDQHGIPMSGISVTFTAPSASGASGAFSNALQTITANTNAAGQLSEAFTANTHAGSYIVTAAAAGVATPANFNLTNSPGTPTSIVVASGSPQSTTVNTAFVPLVVTVADTFGNPVPGVSVTFTAPVAGPAASGTFSNASNTITANTNAAGQLPESFTANTHAGSYTVTAAAAGVATPANFSLTNNPGAATQLVITTPPSNTATAGVNFAVQPVVAEEDQYGNILTADNTHTVTAARGTLGTASLLGGPLTLTLAAGVATFSGLFYDKAETMNLGFTTTAGAFTATSNNIVVSPNVPSHVAFIQQPTNTIAGAVIGPAVTAAIEDAFGNPESADNSTTLSVSIASGPAGGAFTSGSTTVAIVSGGVATFGNLVLDTAGAYTLKATDALLSFTSLASSGFTVSANATIAQVVFGVQPTSAAAGAALSPMVTAKIEDQYGNVETANNAASLTIAIASGPAGAAFAGGSTTTATVSAGVATFTTLKFDTAGNYTLQASDPALSLTSPTSASFVISPTGATQLVFGVQPTNTTAGLTLSPPLTVKIEDQYGNVETADNASTLGITIASGPGAFAGGSTTTATVSGGVATFGNLTLDTAGAYTLTASDASPVLTSAASNNFVISPSAAAQVVFGQQPTNTVAGQAINPAVTAKIEDNFGNVETADNASSVSISVASGPGVFIPASTTTATVNGGVATFGNLALNLTGAYNLGLTATGGLTGPNSSAFLVTPSDLHLVFGQQPTNTVAGVSLTPVTVDIMDQFNNLVTTDNTDSVTLAIVTGPGGFASGSTTTVIANGGVATFYSLVFDKAGTYVLSENSTSATGPNSNTFQITFAAADHLSYSIQPSATFAGGVVSPPVQVTIVDAFGNPVTNNNSDTVTLAIASGPGTFAAGSTTSAGVSSGTAVFGNLNLHTAGIYSLLATDSLGLNGAISLGFIVSPNVPTQLVFGQQPTSITAGGAINPAVTVKIEDQYGNVETSDNSSNLSIAIASGPAGGAFAPGSTTAAVVNAGVATFTTLQLRTAGTYTLQASDSSPVLTTAASNSFVVSPNTAAQIVFGQQPTNVLAGATLSPAVTAKIEDTYGNVETADSASTLNIAIASGPGSFAGGSVTTATVSAGVATFAALKLDTAGSYTLQVSDASPALTSAASAVFVVNPNSATQLVFGQQPSNATAGIPLSPVVTVKIEDAFGNVETADSASSLSIAIASGPVGGVFASGSTTGATVSAGVATFLTLKLNTAGTYTLQASDASPALTSAASSSFVVSPNGATQLVFGQQPTSTAAAAAISPPVSVKIEDVYGNVETGDNASSVTLGIATGPSGGVFAGAATTTTTAIAGVATFSNLVLDTVGTYTLNDSATGGLTGASSGSFQVTPSVAGVHLAFNQEPTAVTAGSAISPAVTVRVLDQFGNLLSGDNTDQVTLAVASGPGGFAGGTTTTVTVSGGIATFSNLLFDTAGTYTLSENATGGLTGVPSNSFVVNPAAGAHLAFIQQPTTTAAGVAINPAVAVHIVDQYGNLVTTDNTDLVTLAVASGPGGFTGASTLFATVSGGVAAFSNLVLDTAGSYTLSESATGGLTGLASSIFQVTGVAPSQLVFGTEPSNIVAGVAMSPSVTVRILDQFGNLASTDNTDQVTLTIASGPAGFTGSSTTTVTASGGIATFGNLVLDTTGSYTLSESATSGLSGPASTSFLVTPSAATHLVFGQQPASAVAGVAVSPAVTVRILDAFNNLVTTDNTDLVTLAIASGPAGFTGTSVTTVTAAAGIATFGNLVLDTTGTYVLSEHAGGLAGPNSNGFQITPAAATHLAYLQQPGTTTAGVAVGPAVTVTILDAFNNVVSTDNTDQVTLTLSSGPGPFAAASTTAVTASSGVATFSNLLLDTAGNYALSESATGGLTGPASSGFTVNPNSATQIVFGQQPTSAAAGVPLSPMVTAKIEDPFGNVEAADNASSLSIAIASGPTGAVFAGGSTISAIVSAGVATFTTLSFDTAGVYTLIASDAAPALSSAASSSFTISPNAATKLIFGQQPTTRTAGLALAPAVTVKIEDQFGNVETSDNSSALNIVVSTGPSGGNFTGGSTTSALVSAGVATFSALTLDTAGLYRLTATDASPSLTSAASNSFSITPAAAAKLAVNQQPSTTVAGVVMVPAVTVDILDAFNNLVTTDNSDQVTLAVASGPGSFTGASTKTVTASVGVATFTNLAFDTAGAYTLGLSTVGGLTGPNTNNFQVVAAAASQLTFSVEPSATVAGVAINPPVTVSILDQFGNLVTTDNADQVTLAVASGPGSFAGASITTANAVGGIATFGNLLLDTTGTYTLSETATGSLSGPASSSFLVTPAAATHLVFGQQPGTTVAGVAVHPAVTVRILDAFNNLVTGDNTDHVSLTLASGPGSFTGGSTTSTTASGGIATFSNLVLDTAGNYSLSENTAGGLTGPTSSVFQVTPAAASQLVFGTQPSNTVAGVAVSPAVTVRILDPFGNLVSSDNTDQVTLTIASGPAGFTGASTTTATASGGIAAFGNLVLDTTGSYTFGETATGGLSGPASSSFLVTPAAATHLVFGQQPTNTVAGVAISPAVTVRILDAFNNLVTTDNTDQVTLAIASGPAGFSGTSTTTVTAAGGIATFGNLVLDTTGAYVLSEHATAGLSGLNSSGFQITPAAATHLAFVQQPGTTTAGVAISPAVTVTILDAFNNVVSTDSTDRVTLTIGTGPGSFTASSTATVTASSGVATFSNLVLDTAGNYVLNDSATGGLAGVSSSSFTVNPNSATQIVFGQQPTNAAAGVALSPLVTAKIEDQFGNVEAADNASSLSIAIASGPTGAVFAGGSTASASVSAGVATFSALTFDTAGVYTLVVSDAAPALSSAASSSFTISPSAATQLIFAQQPTNTTAGIALAPAVIVQIEDQFGNIETGDNASALNIAITSGPAGGSFNGSSTTSAHVSAGVATFTNLTLNTAGTYSLLASDTSPSLSSAASNSFVVSPNVAAKLAVTQQPTTTAAGAAIAPAVTVSILDAFNNVVTADNSDQVSLAIASGPGGFTGASTTTATASAGVATFANLVLNTVGVYTLSESSGSGLTGPNTNSFQVAAATPSQLVFGVQPGTTVAGVAVNPAVTVRILDQFGNLDSSDSRDQVTLAIASGPGGFAGGSTVTVTASGGVATFGNLLLDTTGAYALSATATGGVTGPASSSFLVIPAAATHLAFGQQPATTAAGIAIHPAVTVRILDAFNNLVTADNTDHVTLTLASGPSGFTGGSTTSATASGGIATFSNLVLDAAGTYTLGESTTGGLTGVASNAFQVTPVAASQLAFGVEPSTTVAGVAVSPAVTVRILDQFGNVVSGDNTDQVTLAIASGPAGFTGTSTTTATVSGGIAAFGNLVLDTTGSYTLSESATGNLTGPISTSFQVTPAAATHLVFGQQPTNAVAGVAISPAVTVRILDAFNNLVTTDNTDQVTLAVASGPAGFTGTSATTVTANAGIATFGNLVLDTAGNYVLSERAGGLSGPNSSSFQITPAAATHLAFLQQPGTTTAGVAISPAVTVTILDAFNNVVATDNTDRVSLTIGSGPGPFTGASTTTATASNGIATFSNLLLDTAGVYSLADSATGGLTGVASSAFLVNPNSATQVVFGQQPTNAAAGVPLSPMVTAKIEDQFGNVETNDFASSLGIAIASGPSGAGLAGGSTTHATVSAGVATFAALSFDTAGVYTLVVSDAAPALHSAPSSGFTITPNAATQLIFSQQPTNTTAGIALAPAVTVKIEDQFGNVETLDNASSLNMAIASGPAGSSFAGGSTANIVVSAGVATFTTLTLDTAGTYTLTASDLTPALTSAASNSFVVSPNSATKLAVAQQPTTTVAGAAIAPAVTVRILDAFNNVVTTDDADLVTLAIASGPGSLTATSTTTVTARAGVATFANLALDTAGVYTLSDSTGGGLTGPNSNSFQVVAAAPSQLVFGVQPGATVAGVAINPAVKVNILDQFGNLVTTDSSDQVALAVASGPGSFAGASTTTVTASGGVATFNNLLLDTAGAYTLSETATGNLSGPASSSFLVTPASATHLVFGQQPSTTSVNNAINPAVTVRVLDAFNNLVTADNADQVSMTLTGPGGFTSGSTITATAVGGIATFSNLVPNTQSPSDTLLADNINLGIVTSNSFNVRNPVSSVAVTSSLNPSIFGQAVNLTVTVTGVGGTPSGAVTITEGTTTLAAGALDSSGSTTIQLTGLAAGVQQNLVVNYAGDGLFAPSSKTYLQTVNQANTTTTLSATNPSLYGQAVTFTATVGVVSPGAGTLNGDTVTFLDGSATLGTGIVTGGQATFTTTLLTVGTHSITAVYGPTANFASSTASAVTQTVSPTGTTTSLSATSVSYYGQPITFVATVVAVTGAPVTGTVTFKNGTQVLGAGTVSAGTATFTTTGTQLAINPTKGYAITAVYTGTNNLLPSSSKAQTQFVDQAQTVTNLSSSTSGTSVVGQAVTFTAVVTPVTSGAGVLTGKVTFYDNGRALGAVAVNAGGFATFTTSALTMTSHLITAVYSGAASFAGSSAGVVQVVSATATSVTLLSSQSAGSVFGQAVTLTAIVAIAGPGAGKLTGTVSFYDNGNLLATEAISANGQAKLTTANLAGGTDHLITAVYNGAATLQGASTQFDQTVSPATTATALLTPTVAYWSLNQPIVFTAKVTAGLGLRPTGAVTFTIDGAPQTPITLTGGSATLDFAGFTTTGPHTVSVTYQADTNNFATSSSATLTQNAFDSDTITLAGPTGIPTPGQPVTITATVAGSAETPTGAVSFYDGKKYLGTVNLDDNGSASISLTSLGVGSHSITAVYMGDNDYPPKTSKALALGGRLV